MRQEGDKKVKEKFNLARSCVEKKKSGRMRGIFEREGLCTLLSLAFYSCLHQDAR